MQHINLERLAALADEPATLPERAHLAECSVCTAELAAAQRIVRMAMTDTPAIERPITSWERLGPALRAEGLIRTPLAGTGVEPVTEVVPMASRQPARYRWVMQAAAGLFLAVGGAVIGRASASLPSGSSVGCRRATGKAPLRSVRTSPTRWPTRGSTGGNAPLTARKKL
jgi:hypothetical protein